MVEAEDMFVYMATQHVVKRWVGSGGADDYVCVHGIVTDAVMDAQRALAGLGA